MLHSSLTRVATSLQRASWRRRLVQVMWLALLFLVLYILVVRLRQTLQQAHALCADPNPNNCSQGQVTTEQGRELRKLGLPTDVFALYFAFLRVLLEGVFILVSALIIWRKAWDTMAVFAAFALLMFGGITASPDPQVPPGMPGAVSVPANAVALVGGWATILFFYLFPQGRPVLRGLGVALVIGLVMQTISLPPPPLPAAYFIVPLVIAGPYAIVIFTQFYRYRKISTTTERQQTKWIVYGVAAGLVGFFLTLGVSNIPGIFGNLLVEIAATTTLYGFVMCIPLAIGFAMLRYRLWDVDVLINRTIVYLLLTACLAGLYIGGVVGLQVLFHAVTGEGSNVAVAISTLVIAALFQPLRRRIQSFIDQRFYRRKYDAIRTLATFSVRLRDDVDLDQVRVEIVGAVQEAMQPAHVSLWLAPLRGDERGHPKAKAPTRA